MNNSILSYKEIGQGPVVVLVHGFCESNALWNDIADGLSANYRVVLPDLPGHGESPIFDKESYSMEYFADKLLDLLKALDIKKCVVIGHSLGGYVTLAFAEKYPTYLNGFGLFHSTAFEDSDEKKRNRDRTVEFIGKNGMDTFADSFVAPLFYPKTRVQMAKAIENMKNICRNTSSDAVIATTIAMRDRKERIDVLEKAEVPVLFIIGKEDNAVPLEKSLEQCYLPANHDVTILEEAGHMGMFEKQEEACTVLATFLGKINQ